jgi:hypothetical protein
LSLRLDRASTTAAVATSLTNLPLNRASARTPDGVEEMSHPLVVMALESEGQGRLEKLGSLETVETPWT